jgi:hypothetical protein
MRRRTILEGRPSQRTTLPTSTAVSDLGLSGDKKERSRSSIDGSNSGVSASDSSKLIDAQVVEQVLVEESDPPTLNDPAAKVAEMEKLVRAGTKVAVIFSYQATKLDELDLNENDIIVVTQVQPGGWWRVRSWNVFGYIVRNISSLGYLSVIEYFIKINL